LYKQADISGASGNTSAVSSKLAFYLLCTRGDLAAHQHRKGTVDQDCESKCLFWIRYCGKLLLRNLWVS